MRLYFAILVSLLFILTACAGGTDTGNPNIPQENSRFNPPYDDAEDGCQEPFEYVCRDGTRIYKDPETCEWELCP